MGCSTGAGGKSSKGGANSAPRIGDTFSKSNGRNTIEFQILDMRGDDSVSIQVTRSTLPSGSAFPQGKKMLVNKSFLEEGAKKVSSSPARRNKNTYLGSEREQAFKEIPKLSEGTTIRAGYANGGSSVYTVSIRNGKTYLTSDSGGRRKLANTASSVSNIMGRPTTIEIRKKRA